MSAARDGEGASAIVVRSDRWLVALMWLAAAAVVLGLAGNALRAERQGWVLEGDNAAIATSTFDTAHGHPRLVGVHSSASAYAEIDDLYHPGPLAYWLMAAPAGLFGWSSDGFLFVTALVNSLSVLGVAVSCAAERDRR